ncbi:MAG: adenylate/guanylate cyclase domain-containing protein [Rhodoferax sp.]|nr:adenylate/guanylate cyclase domain-containing protein [Rhodoferax sp.]
MSSLATVVFADLFGSTGVFESLGNARATEVVTRTTSWLAQRCTEGGGKVIKLLGDGVLVVFDDSRDAIETVLLLQRKYQLLLSQTPTNAYMPLRIGVARGGVEFVENDCYGDAVNIASRLSELTGAHQIWVNRDAVEDAFQYPDERFRSLGSIPIRGRAEPCMVYQVEWQEDSGTGELTIQADLELGGGDNARDALGIQICLVCLDQQRVFHAFDLPIHVGRSRQVEFVVDDVRVSRKHARIDWRNGSVVLVDVSSYGSWVRFAGGGPDLLLRREECVLHGQGEIALGAALNDPSAPLIHFSVQ